MTVVRLSEDTWLRLQRLATPLRSSERGTPEKVIRHLLDQHEGGHMTTTTEFQSAGFTVVLVDSREGAEGDFVYVHSVDSADELEEFWPQISAEAAKVAREIEARDGGPPVPPPAEPDPDNPRGLMVCADGGEVMFAAVDELGDRRPERAAMNVAYDLKRREPGTVVSVVVVTPEGV